MFREFLQTLSSLFTWVVIVAPWEQAIRVRAGKNVHLLRAGAHLRIPFIDRFYRQPIRMRRAIVPSQLVTTKDGKAIALSGSLGYEISDLLKLYQTMHDAQDTIQADAQSRVAEFISAHTMEECSPVNIETHVEKYLRLARYGLKVDEFKVVDIAVVKPYRLISGELRTWQHSMALRTDMEWTVNGGVNVPC